LFWTIQDSVLAGSSFDNCPVPIAPGVGAILDKGNTVAGNIRYTIQRTIYWHNWPGCAGPAFALSLASDLPSFRAADYVVAHNLLQQQPPPGGWTGPNASGDPRWFQYSPIGFLENDYHLLPGSPAIDLGGAPAPDQHGFAFEGDPLLAPCGDGNVDAGLDEYRLVAVWLAPQPKLGTTSRLRGMGPLGGFGAAFAGVALPSVPCGGAAGLASGILLFAGPVDGQGRFGVPLAVPPLVSLIGQSLPVQSAGFEANGVFRGFSQLRSYAILR